MLKHARRPKPKGRKRPIPHKLEPKCKKVERLFGPVELDIFDRDNSNGKTRVVLLGDMHTSRKHCPSETRCGVSIWSYLETLFQQYTGSIPLDFFLELPFADDNEQDIKGITPQRATLFKREIVAENKPYRNYLASLHIYFFNCWQKVKSICEFYKKPIRFHYSDVREGVIHSSSEFEDRITIRFMRDLINIHNDDVEPHHMNILHGIIEKFIKGNIDYFFRLSKIDKQLHKIDKLSQAHLRQMMTDHIRNTFEFANAAKAILNEMIQTKSSTVYETAANEKPFAINETAFFASADKILFSELSHFVIGGFLSPLFDIYTLARMIRHDMRHVIIYAGAMHTRRIRWFLETRLGYVKKVSVVSKREGANFQCINMKRVPQPWFI